MDPERARLQVASRPWLGQTLHYRSADRREWRSGDRVGGPTNRPAMPRAHSTLAPCDPRRRAGGHSATKAAETAATSQILQTVSANLPAAPIPQTVSAELAN